MRFSLILFTATSIWIGWFVFRAKAQQKCVSEILQQGGGVIYSHSYTNGTYDPDPPSPGPMIIRESLGLDYVDHIVAVDFNQSGISQLPNLNRLPKLKSLWLYDTSVTDLSPASQLSYLESLWIQDTQVNCLEAVRNCRHLKWLNIAGTQVSDLSPLNRLSKLETLIVSGTPIDLRKLDDFRALHPNCQVIE